MYSNFVKSSSCFLKTEQKIQNPSLCGEEVRKIYLKEVQDFTISKSFEDISVRKQETSINSNNDPPIAIDLKVSNKDLLIMVQNNEVSQLKAVLDRYPEKIDIVDDYGWSLLMVACQANSVDTAKELLARGIDTTVRDKAGNSAYSLVIKNKSFILADVLLSSKHNKCGALETKSSVQNKKDNEKQQYLCHICNKVYLNKNEHLSSTVHNINVSKGKKNLANYAIPVTNKGYQIMLKVGWDKDSGLGKDGAGKIYPIKAFQKKDRKGLGHKKSDVNVIKKDTNYKNKKKLDQCHKNSCNLEIQFRREFY